MEPKYLEMIRCVCRRPEMFCPKRDIAAVIGWIGGYADGIHEATGQFILEGFNAWLINRMGWYNNIHWYGLANEFEQHEPKEAALKVLALIEEFVALPDTQPSP